MGQWLEFEIIPGTGGIMGQNIWATIKGRLHSNAPLLGDILVPLVQAKTPVRTGALQSDITYEVEPDVDSEDLLFVYAEDVAQELYWQRIYVQYQEGPPLGLSTFTNDPRQMFERTATGDGLEATRLWAEISIQEGIGLVLSGAGIPWP